MKKGIILKSISGEFTILLENNEKIVCKPRGLFKYNNLLPKVGDYVQLNEKTKSIITIENRKNDLLRPSVANVDTIFLVFSVKEPELNLNLLDRMLAIYEYNSIDCVIVLTKLDLLDDKSQVIETMTYYKNLGYCIYTSANDLKIEDIADEISNKVCVFAGQSGVGKSTLLNLMGHSIKTNEISLALNRGKHTTRHVELLEVADGYIADTPGFGIVDFEMDETTLSQNFKEFFENSSECKFSGCLHINEPGCNIKKMVENGTIFRSRYDNYLKFIEEIKEKKTRRKK